MLGGGLADRWRWSVRDIPTSPRDGRWRGTLVGAFPYSSTAADIPPTALQRRWTYFLYG
jgi:hypothetical protein